ncbi:60 kDa SS-A/Ro ribonucleoprotein [Irineochytrium annulatum]|nr:60 kDa SS-A/Ro ribonucleoprotein [Irineochytrium annulatum]
MASPSTLAIKVTLGENTRRFTIHPQEKHSWHDIDRQIRQLHGVLPSSTLHVIYLDEENEEISIDSDAELADLIATTLRNGASSIKFTARVKVAANTSGSTNADSREEQRRSIASNATFRTQASQNLSSIIPPPPSPHAFEREGWQVQYDGGERDIGNVGPHASARDQAAAYSSHSSFASQYASNRSFYLNDDSDRPASQPFNIHDHSPSRRSDAAGPSDADIAAIRYPDLASFEASNIPPLFPPTQTDDEIKRQSELQAKLLALIAENEVILEEKRRSSAGSSAAGGEKAAEKAVPADGAPAAPTTPSTASAVAAGGPKRLPDDVGKFLDQCRSIVAHYPEAVNQLNLVIDQQLKSNVHANLEYAMSMIQTSLMKAQRAGASYLNSPEAQRLSKAAREAAYRARIDGYDASRQAYEEAKIAARRAREAFRSARRQNSTTSTSGELAGAGGVTTYIRVGQQPGPGSSGADQARYAASASAAAKAGYGIGLPPIAKGSTAAPGGGAGGVDPQRYATQMKKLADMGFKDPSLNRDLLDANNGEVERVVEALMQLQYIAQASNRAVESTPQTRPIPGREGDMTLNNAGGFTFVLDPLARLNRFLILGSEKGSYYATEQALTAENASTIVHMLETGRGVEVVEAVCAISEAGRAPKQDPGIFALALAIRLGDEPTKRAAYGAVDKVCRIPTTLFQLVELVSRFGDVPVAEEGGAVERTPAVRGGRGRGRGRGGSAMKQSRKPAKKPKGKVATTGRGFGKGMRKMLASWYNGKDAKSLAYTVTKYKNRNGWTHADILRVGHVRPADRAHDLVFRFLTHGIESMRGMACKGVEGVVKGVEAMEVVEEDWEMDVMVEDVAKIAAPPAAEEGEVAEATKEAEMRRKGPKTYTSKLEENAEMETKTVGFLEVTDQVLKCGEKDIDKVVSAIKNHRLAREHIPSSLLNSVAIWGALLAANMGMTAMIRNLAKMTAVGLLKPLSDAVDLVCKSLRDPVKLAKARIHPFNVLVALNQYKQGRGHLGSLTWEPVSEVLDALDDAFYASFNAVEPTGKRHLVGLDVSGSMSFCKVVGNDAINCAMAAAAMCMTLLRTEPRTHVVAFQDRLVPLNLFKTDSLDAVLRKTRNLPFGSTDCGQPILYALENGIEVDVFVIYTDNETYAGKVHPCEALKRYRRKMGIPARMIVVGLASNEFSIADPEDAGMMDVVGFDSAAPSIMREFSLGKV